MKLSDDFDARRLRPRQPGNWRLRLGAAFGALLATLGILLLLTGIASLAGRVPRLTSLTSSTETMAVFGLSLILLWLGIAVWRRCRRRLLRPSDLSMAPYLLKKRD